MRHLADMPVSGGKVDRSSVSATSTDERSAAVVRAILCMAHELGLRSVVRHVLEVLRGVVTNTSATTGSCSRTDELPEVSLAVRLSDRCRGTTRIS